MRLRGSWEEREWPCLYPPLYSQGYFFSLWIAIAPQSGAPSPLPEARFPSLEAGAEENEQRKARLGLCQLQRVFICVCGQQGGDAPILAMKPHSS